MIYEIKNEFLTVQLNTTGASLWSIKNKEGQEYLWQGNPAYWEDRAPNLFPYIARLTEKTYTLMGKSYKMDIHGFACRSEFQVAQQENDSITFFLEDGPDTRMQYPYRFRLEISYCLADACIRILFRVFNQDDKTMYFGIGGHPGFLAPLEPGLSFEDYYLEFSQKARPKRVAFSQDCFVTGLGEEYPLKEGRRLPLSHSLFDNDAIVLWDMPKEVSLKSNKGKRMIRLRYPQMKYLGIWHMPHTEAPYVCLEPWSSLPSRKGVIEDLEKQENLESLAPNMVYENKWEIQAL